MNEDHAPKSSQGHVGELVSRSENDQSQESNRDGTFYVLAIGFLVGVVVAYFIPIVL